MYASDNVTSFRNRLNRFFTWRSDCTTFLKLDMAIIMACFTGLGAQVRIYTPFTPVPITGQVFFVLLSAVLLGKWWGGVSQAVYTGIGILGVPWFAPSAGMPAFSKGGINVLFSATGGYIIGFIAAALLVGWLLDRYARSGKKITVVLCAMVAGILVIHLFGAVGLLIVVGSAVSLAAACQVVITSLVLFLPLDLAKAAGVGAVSYGILPRRTTGNAT
jgi:biotin transport system substrate-specific component